MDHINSVMIEKPKQYVYIKELGPLKSKLYGIGFVENDSLFTVSCSKWKVFGSQNFDFLDDR